MSCNYSVVYCPVCGSIDLLAYYDQANDRHAAKNPLKSSLWKIFTDSRKNKDSTVYWVCQDCGKKFLV